MTIAQQEIERKKRLQILIMKMKEYANKFHQDEEELKKNLYKRYNVTTRGDLLLDEIDAEIESFKSAILSGIA